MYDYRVKAVHRVVDGDTVDLVIDLGFYMTATLRIRLLGVDTPERGQEGYHEAKGYTDFWLAQGLKDGEVRIATRKADSFGRWLGNVYTADASGKVWHLADELIENSTGLPATRKDPA